MELIKQIIELSGVILGSLGGGAVIIFGFSSWLGKVWANRLMTKEKVEYAQELESLRNRLTQDTESYKIKLKKSEFIFQKEFEAASEFVGLIRNFLPKYSHPDMDWGDACDEIAICFEDIETLLSSYLSKHGAILQDDVKDLITDCIGIAGKNKFETNITEKVPFHVNEEASKLYKKLKDAEKSLINQVHSQSST